MFKVESTLQDTKTEQLGLRITPAAKALLKAAALKEHRSASNMVEHLILDYCERNNISLGKLGQAGNAVAQSGAGNPEGAE